MQINELMEIIEETQKEVKLFIELLLWKQNKIQQETDRD